MDDAFGEGGRIDGVSTPWLVVGLGNPGAQYARTRHNAGHRVVEVLCRRTGATLGRARTRAHVGEARLGVGPGGAPGPRALFAVLDVYMNESGGPIAALARYLGVDAAHLLVVHDDLDLPEHSLRLKRGGGEAGHNGLKSISAALGTRDYARLRVGIGRPPGRMDPADYVLAPFPARAAQEWAVTFERAADAAQDVAIRGFLPAQQTLHSPHLAA